MRVSVVTPSFNMKNYLRPTIESVLANLLPGDEYFIVDGGSGDGSTKLIRTYENRLTGWLSEPDRCYADALAKGFARSSGEIMCWINAGDVLLSGALQSARRALESTRADLVFGDDFYIDEGGRVLGFSRGHVRSLRHAMLYGGWTPLQDACFWRRSLYDRVGGIDPNLRYAADYDLFLRMALTGTSVYVSETFSAFRRHPGQKSIANTGQYAAEREQVRKRELTRLPESRLRKATRTAWHNAAVRWRVHVRQRGWRRDDLVGRPIDELSCARYWPATSNA
jgi:glycosyltransferase involved in cell wall biosynthesis